MNAGEIKKLRTASILKELLPEALAQLGDAKLRSLNVVDVECKKGRFDAFIYLDKMFYTQSEQEELLTKLAKASRTLQFYCMSEQGWFKSPNFHFKFDDRLEYQNHLDDLFAKAKEQVPNMDEDMDEDDVNAD